MSVADTGASVTWGGFMIEVPILHTMEIFQEGECDFLCWSLGSDKVIFLFLFSQDLTHYFGGYHKILGDLSIRNACCI